MWVAQLLAIVGLLSPVVALGTLWCRMAWRTNDRRACLFLGVLTGISAHLVALNALSYLIRPAAAGWCLFAAESLLTACTILWARMKRRAVLAPWAAGEVEKTRPIVAFFGLVLLAVIVAWVYQAFTLGAVDAIWHASLCGVLARNGLPTFHPFDPSCVLAYHYAPDLLVASFAGMTGWPHWELMECWTALGIPLLAAAGHEFLRAASEREDRPLSKFELYLALTAFLLGGGLGWLRALTGCGPGFFHRDGGWDGLSSLCRMSAIASGWTWLLGIWAAVLRWPREAPTQPRGMSPAIPFGLMLGILPLMAEHAAVLLGVAFLVLTLLRTRTSAMETLRPADLPAWLAAGALAVGIGLVQGGFVTVATLGLSHQEGWSLRWTGTFWPSFPNVGIMASRHPPGSAEYFWTLARDYGIAPLLAPILLYWAFRRRSQAPLSARVLLATTATGMPLALYVVDPNTFRYGQAFAGAVYLGAGLWAARVFLSHGRTLVKAVAGLLLLLLLLQGARLTVLSSIERFPGEPYQCDAGMQEALRTIEAEGRAREGILTAVGYAEANPVPPTPALLGYVVPCSEERLSPWLHRSQAWLGALQTPSPRNLFAARTRWVCASENMRIRNVPLLEGLPSFEAYGPKGENPIYFLYRYAGSWELPKQGLDDIRRLYRYAPTAIRLGERPLRLGDQRALMDGRTDTGPRLNAEVLSKEGLLAVWPKALPVSLVWLAGADGTMLGSDFEVAVSVLRADSVWEPATRPLAIRFAERPLALGVRFEPSQAAGVRVFLKPKPPRAAPEQVTLTEVWIGNATEYEPFRP